MHIKVIYVSGHKNSKEKLIYEEYIKRISKYNSIELIRVEAYKSKDIKKVIQVESERIKKIVDQSFSILMDVDSEQYGSVEFSKKIINNNLNRKDIFFIIGGSWGVKKSILNPNVSISFGKITIAHRLFLCLLLEQIYRSFKIINGEEYHK